MEFAPDPLLFAIAGLDQLPFQPLVAGDVAPRGTNHAPARREGRIPLKPSISSVLATKPGLEAGRVAPPRVSLRTCAAVAA